MKIYDTIIIGRGPAGLQAAIYTARSGLSTLVLGRNDGALAKADRIENFFGFPGAVNGKMLLEAATIQATNFGAIVKDENVLALEMSSMEPGCYDVTCGNDIYTGRSILLAVGKALPRINKEGIKELEGRGISYCATCDGFLYRKKKLGVLGAGEYALHEAEVLRNFSQDITVYTDGQALYPEIENIMRAYGMKISTGKIQGFGGKAPASEKILDKIIFEGGSHENIDGLFIAYDRPGASDFALKLGLLSDSKGNIKVDEKMVTNLPGVFAAGDCACNFKQIATAVGQGALASESIITYIKKKHSQ
ncbi:MAG: NAD(P)/FAD-dependent oxidoreductase [Ruminococcaceae bacterium]|nr:NAD(P)/FAD-dependent oxidoreductase [Oscillospiraceae bacterium]